MRDIVTQNNGQGKHIMVYLDESGNIHKNSRNRYYAIGGFCCDKEALQKIKSSYKRANKKIKEAYAMNPDDELKACKMDETQKIALFDVLQQNIGFHGIGIVFDKKNLCKAIEGENIFYNYGVKVLFDDVILPLIDESNEEIIFHVFCDNRSVKSCELKDLQSYLSTCFVFKNFSFTVEYRNSAHEYSIQIADLIANTAFMSQEHREMVENVLQTLDKKFFSIAYFPDRKEKTDKIF